MTSASTLPASSRPEGSAPPSEFSNTLRIIATAILSFACYITIGMQLAVVPSFVHLTLHYSAVIAGLAVSVQYVATLASRPFAGHTSDTKGAKRATASGLCSIIASGALFTVAILCPATAELKFKHVAIARPDVQLTWRNRSRSTSTQELAVAETFALPPDAICTWYDPQTISAAIPHTASSSWISF